MSTPSKRQVVNKASNSLAPVYWAVGITGSLIVAGLIIIFVILLGDGDNKQDRVAENDVSKGRRTIATT